MLSETHMCLRQNMQGGSSTDINGSTNRRTSLVSSSPFLRISSHASSDSSFGVLASRGIVGVHGAWGWAVAAAVAVLARTAQRTVFRLIRGNWRERKSKKMRRKKRIAMHATGAGNENGI